LIRFREPVTVTATQQTSRKSYRAGEWTKDALSESASASRVLASKPSKEMNMPPAKKAAPAAKKAATVATPATKAVPAKKAAPVAKKIAAPAKKAAASAKKSAAKKAAPQVTITLKQMAAELAEGHDLPKKVAEAVLGDLVTVATTHLKKGDKVRLTGLGILQVRAREARMGRNPATGESIEIAASRKIAFRPAKELKEAV
jgi:DNA-binding protein HU-beta